MYIQSGSVKLSVLSRTGKEAVVAVLGAGDFFGEGCLAGQGLRMSTATAMTPSTILAVDRGKMARDFGATAGDVQFYGGFLGMSLLCGAAGLRFWRELHVSVHDEPVRITPFQRAG